MRPLVGQAHLLDLTEDDPVVAGIVLGSDPVIEPHRGIVEHRAGRGELASKVLAHEACSKKCDVHCRMAFAMSISFRRTVRLETTSTATATATPEASLSLASVVDAAEGRAMSVKASFLQYSERDESSWIR